MCKDDSPAPVLDRVHHLPPQPPPNGSCNPYYEDSRTEGEMSFRQRYKGGLY